MQYAREAGLDLITLHDVFDVVTAASYVEQYEFTLSMLLEFNPRSGKTTALVTLPIDYHITAAVFDAQSQLVVLAVDADVYPTYTKHTAIYDTRSSALTWHNFSSAALPRFAGVDPAGGKALVVQNVGAGPKTNYEFGHFDHTL